MTLDEWNAVLATELLTPMQLGAVHHEFTRLSFRDPHDRRARLAASAALLGFGELDSITSLTMGEAGFLVRALEGFADRAALDAAAAIGRESGAEDECDGLAPEPARLTLAEALRSLFIMLAWSQHARGPDALPDSTQPGETIPPGVLGTDGPAGGSGPS